MSETLSESNRMLPPVGLTKVLVSTFMGALSFLFPVTGIFYVCLCQSLKEEGKVTSDDARRCWTLMRKAATLGTLLGVMTSGFSVVSQGKQLQWRNLTMNHFVMGDMYDQRRTDGSPVPTPDR